MFLELAMIGNLGQDPEARDTADGTPVVSFPVAVTRRWTDREGQKQEETTWVDVTVWGGMAETCRQYLVKGRHVFVRGRPEARAFIRKNGQAVSATLHPMHFHSVRMDHCLQRGPLVPWLPTTFFTMLFAQTLGSWLAQPIARGRFTAVAAVPC